jgi:hypothetical protein
MEIPRVGRLVDPCRGQESIHVLCELGLVLAREAGVVEATFLL